MVRLSKVAPFVTTFVITSMMFATIIFASFLFANQEPQYKPEKVKTEVVDQIAIKQREMLKSAVRIEVRDGSGSGTIIERFDSLTTDIFEYIVLTNTHIIDSRIITRTIKVDVISGQKATIRWDTGCAIIVFNNSTETYDRHKARILVEDNGFDLALLSFESTQKFPVVKIADTNILDNVRVFDEVFVIGCQYGNIPGPTTGIITEILTRIDGDEIWCVYSGTAQMAPGSSGGGLFKEYEGHYYLIGIPFRVRYDLRNRQIIPHIAQSISMVTANKFLDQYAVCLP